MEREPQQSEPRTPPDAAASGDAEAVSAVESASVPTGNRRVDEAVAQLSELDELEVADHAARYQEIHRSLAQVLDEAPDDEAEPWQSAGSAPQSDPSAKSAAPWDEQSPQSERPEQ